MSSAIAVGAYGALTIRATAVVLVSTATLGCWLTCLALILVATDPPRKFLTFRSWQTFAARHGGAA